MRVFLLSILLASCSLPDKPAVKADAPSIQVTAKELMRAYEANEVAADGQYKGKVLEVSGLVNDIKKDILDQPYVSVGTGKDLEIPDVQCNLAKGEEAKAATLKKKQKIKVKGTDTGLMMSVQLEGCIILE